MRHKLVYVLLIILFAGSCAPDVVQHNNAGNERFEEQDYDEALAEYRQAQVENPDLAAPYYNAANAYNRQAQLEAVQAQAQQALKTANPDLAAQAWYNLGNAYFDAEQWPPAIAAYQEALRLTPSDQDAKHNLELALQKLEEQEQQEQEQQEQQEQEQEQQEQQEQEQQEQEQQEQEQAQEQEQQEQEQQAESAEQSPEEGMTPEQAMQLLQALMGSETLQERLQEMYVAPAPPPEQDW